MGGGNFPFRKFALEGIMTLDYMERFYGEEVVDGICPVREGAASPRARAGASSSPTRSRPPSIDRRSLMDYRRHPEVVSGLTWTDNGEAEAGSVRACWTTISERRKGPRGLYFAGHRPVSGRYRLRAGGRLVQIHDPERFMIAHLPAMLGDRPGKGRPGNRRSRWPGILIGG